MAIKLVQLHERLFVRGHTRHVDPLAMLRELQARQIGYVLNVALIPDYALEGSCRLIGIQYKHAPLHDSQDIDSEQIKTLAWSVAKAMKGDSGVLIHCDSGWNRSNLIAISALMLHTGRPAAELIAEARKLRPKVLKNKMFEQFVLDLRW